jgi:hypothetical protein
MGQLLGTTLQSGPGLLQNLLGLGQLGLTGAGLLGNLQTAKQRQDQINVMKQQEALQQQYIKNPALLAEKVQQAQLPLTEGLIQEISGPAIANQAARGLAESPYITAATIAQSIAPWEIQQQQAAQNMVMQTLGLPIQTAGAVLQGLPGPVNLAPALSMLPWWLQNRTDNPYAPNTSTPESWYQQNYPAGPGFASAPGDYGEYTGFNLPTMPLPDWGLGSSLILPATTDTSAFLPPGGF